MPQLHILETKSQAIPQKYSIEELNAMQRAMLNLSKVWQLSETEMATLLGGISTRTFARWKNGNYGRVSIDLADRMSLLLGIHKALRLIFKDKDRGYQWIKKANQAFDEMSALDVMMRGHMSDLLRVRQYLDQMRSPW